MRGTIRTSVLFGILGLGTAGCCTGAREVRYVYQDAQSGVIGLPENSSRWPTNYRKHAEELMAKHFPEGYEVVRAEEVIKGTRTVTVNGTNSAEIEPALTSRLLSFGKLGRTSTRSQLDTMKLKECRIVYKKTGAGPAPRHGDFAEQAMWTPAPYTDPNLESKGRPASSESEAEGTAVEAGKPAATSRPEEGSPHPQEPTVGPGPETTPPLQGEAGEPPSLPAHRQARIHSPASRVSQG